MSNIYCLKSGWVQDLIILLIICTYHDVTVCITLTILAICLLKTLLYQNKLILSYSDITCLLAVFTVLAAISVTRALIKENAFYGSMEVLIPFIAYVILLQNKKEYFYENIEEKIVNIGFGLCLYGIVMSFFRNLSLLPVVFQERLMVGITYANTFGAFSLICLILSNKIYKDYKEVWLVQSVFWMGIILSGSRGSFIFAITALLITIFYKKKKSFTALVSAVTGIAGGVLISKAPQFLSATERMSKISINASELQERFFYYKDAVALLKDFPWGIGSGNNMLYQGRIQTAYYYDIDHLHNGILQFAVDFGVIAAVIFMVAFAIYMIKRNGCFYEKLAALCLFGHGMIDFDWKYPCMLSILYLLYVKTETENIKTFELTFNKKALACVMISFFIVINIEGARFAWFCVSEQPKKALEIYSESSNALILLAEEQEKEKNYSNSIKTLESINKSIIENDEKIMQKMTEDYVKTENFYMAYVCAKRLTELRPLNIENFNQKADIGMKLAKYEIENENFEEAEIVLNEVLNIENELKYYQKRVSPNADKLKHKVRLHMTEELLRSRTEAEKMLGNIG